MSSIPRRHRCTGLRTLLLAGTSALVVAACGGGGSSSRTDALTLKSVFPSRGTASGGQQIQLSGQGFVRGMKVTIAGQACEALVVLNASSLTCVTPAHQPGAVDLQVMSPDGRAAALQANYTYRPSGATISSFGIVATAPSAGVHDAPFSAVLDSVVTGFDASTIERAWVVNGKSFGEGDTAPFDNGRNTISLTVRDASGDTDSISYAIVVDASSTPLGNLVATAPGNVAGQFVVASGQTIVASNAGLSPILNPRFVGVGKPDYVDWSRYLQSLARLSSLPTDASESSRAMLLDAAWKDLSNSTVHVCSPGREGENITDPGLLLRGYGYECCSDASRALAYLGSYLDIPARVRSTNDHEFPEFDIAGHLVVLDPDRRFRFWTADRKPLSAWSTDDEPLSLMNVPHYFVETSRGDYLELRSDEVGQSGNAISDGWIRSPYYQGIVGETIWGYREAFSGQSYVLYPGERVAFQLTSSYAPLQRLDPSGAPVAGDYAPAVGAAVFRRLWSENGPRVFQSESDGSRAIPLNGLPFPLQDLVFRFSEPVNPPDYWLKSRGEIHRIGDFSSNEWRVSAAQLGRLTDVSDLTAIVPRSQDLVAVDIGMQFNPAIFGANAGSVSVDYLDDSGSCQRSLRVHSGEALSEFIRGSLPCDSSRQSTIASYGLSSGESGVGLVYDFGNSYAGTWGLVTVANVKAFAEISVPRTPGLHGVLRATHEGHPLDWYAQQNGQWTALRTTDAARSQWVELPTTDASTMALRMSMRTAPGQESTYLSYLSLVEGVDPTTLPFAWSTAGTDVAPASAK